MKLESRHEVGDVKIVLNAGGLISGWDIEHVSIRGHDLPPSRKGEFETEAEAKQAALERAEQYRKDHIHSKTS